MAGRGPAPKDVRQRGRDNKRTTITWDGTSIWGEDLPQGIPYGGKEAVDGVLVWHPMTLKWWDAWRRWPALKDAHPVMWNFLLGTALMVNQMWQNGRWDFAAEIRLREKEFGATPQALKSLGYDYELEGESTDDDDQPKGPGTVTDISSRRGRLTGDAPATPAKKAPARKRAPAKKAVAAKKAPVKKAAPARARTAKKKPADPDAPPF